MVAKNTIHSRVGLVTNSSSETYTWPLEGIEATLRALGEKLINTFDPGASFDDVFEIRKTLSSSGKESIRYNNPEWAPEGIASRIGAAEIMARDLLVPEGTTEAWYKLPNSVEIREAMNQAGDRVIAEEINLDEIPRGGGHDGYSYTNGNLKYTLVVKATGVTFDFDSIFDSMYATESCYNG